MGSGNSGAGALHDYLVSRQDSFSPFNGYEFRLINDPDGLDWLYNSLYTNFNINNCALSFLRFKRYIQRLIKSNYNRKYLLYDDQVNKLTLKFIDNITFAVGEDGYASADVRPRVKRNREEAVIDIVYIIICI